MPEANSKPTPEFELLDPLSDRAVWAITQYFAELHERFATGFEAADAITSDAPQLRPPHGLFVVMSIDNQVAGCGGAVQLSSNTAELKRMWVSNEFRGIGLGSRLLTHLEDRVENAGYSKLRLDTNGALTEAVKMYERAGYSSIERYNDNPYAHHFFEKSLST